MPVGDVPPTPALEHAALPVALPLLGSPRLRAFHVVRFRHGLPPLRPRLASHALTARRTASLIAMPSSTRARARAVHLVGHPYADRPHTFPALRLLQSPHFPFSFP